MCVGDACAQLSVGEKLDARRNAASSAYNGLASPVFFQWYRVMDWLIPGSVGLRLIPKTLLSQLVTTGGNNPCYLAWCNHVEAWLNSASDADAARIDWAAVRQRTAEQCRETLPKLYGSSMLFWLPVTGALPRVPLPLLRHSSQQEASPLSRSPPLVPAGHSRQPCPSRSVQLCVRAHPSAHSLGVHVLRLLGRLCQPRRSYGGRSRTRGTSGH